jgi:hypothetical protein
MTTAAIMQPTYLPWSGYFGLIEYVDEFVLLDTVQFAKRSWQQRNQIKAANGPMWLTVPVISKGLQNQKICDVKIDTARDFPNSHIRSIELNFSKAPYFNEYAPSLIKLLETGYDKLSTLTLELITWLCQSLEITTPLILASQLDAEGARAELLASICQKIRASTYMSPPGSKIYLDDSNALENRNIDLSYFKYEHPSYPQLYGDFIPNMSIIDLLFNSGPESKSTLLSGCFQ